MSLTMAPPDVTSAGRRAVGLAETLATQVRQLEAAPLQVAGDLGQTPDRLAADLGQALTELRRDLDALLSLAMALSAAATQISTIDEELAHAVPFPPLGSGAFTSLPIHLSELAGTLLAEAVVHATPPELTRIVDPLLAAIPEGPGWAGAAGPPQPEAASPRSPAAWFATISDVQAHPGQIAVTHLDNGRWVVSLPGIHALTEAADPLDLAGAAHALATGHGAYAGAVVMALTLARVPTGAQIMLVGHSQGGIVAADVAADPQLAGRWRFTHLLTAASPIDDTAIPPSTNVLALRNRDDIVPQLDLDPTPQRTLTTVSFDDERGAIGANHDLAGTYTPFAESSTFARNPGVRSWETSAAGYLTGGAATTQRFQLLDRAPPRQTAKTTPGRG